MSGERRFKLVGLFALILICSVFMIASAASAEGEEGDNNTYLLDLANLNQNTEGDWDDDVNTTIILSFANVGAQKRYEPHSEEFIVYGDAAQRGIDYTIDYMEYNDPVETVTFFLIIDSEIYDDSDADGLADIQNEVKDELLTLQDNDGSWNNDIGDTAMATYGLAKFKDENKEAVVKSVNWLQYQENQEEHSWGSIEDDSKAILALDSVELDVWDELAALMLKQKPDGSFGGIEDTSWAVMALSTNPNKDTLLSMERAVTWLRAQNYDDSTEDLAMAALAEQYYENAKFENDSKESGFIPPTWMYALSIFIISSLILGYWLFARLERDAILDGVRRELYVYITEHPGEHLANITKKFDLSSSSARYHLSVLEGMDKIVSHKNGKYKRYYINKNGYSKYTNGNGYKHIMSTLKNNTARKIVKFLISNPGSNQKRVSNALKIHPSTVNWHAKRLRDAEIISKHKKGKEIVYELNQDVQLSKVIGIIEGSPA
ncbi:MAG: winged helix-turn-helix transcriptional regulator [Thermoplasmata archaeon]